MLCAFLRLIPSYLVALRFALGPIIIIGVVQSWPGGALVTLLTLGVLSDIFHGIIARRFGVATLSLRQADSAVDIVFWLCVLIAAITRNSGLIPSHGIFIGLLLLSEALCQIFSFARFRRPPATHTYAAKLWGLMLFFGFALLLIPLSANTYIGVVLVFGLVVNAEVIAIIWLSPIYPVDVPSVSLLVRRRVNR